MSKRRIEFIKVTATGNDFIVIDNRKYLLKKTEDKFFKKICKRRFSVGADGVILIDEIDNQMKVTFMNPDGNEAGMCGNGGRAAAYYLSKTGIVNETDFTVSARDGAHKTSVTDDTVKFQINCPDTKINEVSVKPDDRTYTGFLTNTGVSHYIVFEKNISEIDVREIGRKIRNLRPFLPEGTNVNFVQLENNHKAFVRTFEKGVEDETYACGTGATASVLTGIMKGYFTYPVEMVFKGGTLTVSEENNEIFIVGKVNISYFGEVEY